MITDEQIQELRQRNEIRMQAVKESMGAKWVLHPENAPMKKLEERILK